MNDYIYNSQTGYTASDTYTASVWVKFLPDGNGTFTNDMNMISDRSASGMGQRSFRYSMYVDDRQIIKLFKDENGKYDVSDPKTMIKFLKERE